MAIKNQTIQAFYCTEREIIAMAVIFGLPEMDIFQIASLSKIKNIDCAKLHAKLHAYTKSSNDT